MTGQVRDRARADGSRPRREYRDVASIAATGFGLTGLCIAAERGWLPRATARRSRANDDPLSRARDAARTRLVPSFRQRENRRPRVAERGVFHRYRAADRRSVVGPPMLPRRPRADAVGGTVYRRIDFGWMRNGEPALLSMGWKPESGFLSAPLGALLRADDPVDLLGIASPTHRCLRRPGMRGGVRPCDSRALLYVGAADPLFVHQYAHAWIDFRGRRESRAPHIDWWENSVRQPGHTRPFCLSLRQRFPAYTEQIWGITASDGPHGYQAWGGPPEHGPIDGTVVPAAAAGSLMFSRRSPLGAESDEREVRRENLRHLWVRRCVPAARPGG